MNRTRKTKGILFITGDRHETSAHYKKLALPQPSSPGKVKTI